MPAKSRVVRAAERVERNLRDGWAAETAYLAPDDGPSTFSLRRYRLRPDRGPGPLHSHTRSDSAYYVLAGRVEVRLGDERHVLGPGDLAFIAPGTSHSIENVGLIDARIIELYAPADADFVHLPSLPD